MLVVPLASASSTVHENPLLNNPDKLAEIATAFGISTDTLTQELQDGKKLKQIAIEYNVAKETADEYVKHGPKPILGPDLLQKIADELGISTDDVKTALKSHTLKSLFIDKGIDMKTFMQSIGAPPFKHGKPHNAPKQQ